MRHRLTVRAHLVNLLVMTSSVGCTRSATQLLVSVDSDIDPASFSSIVISVGDGLGPPQHRTFGPGQPHGSLADLGLPFSFGVTPKNGDHVRRALIIIRGTGLHEGGSFEVERRAVAPFIEHQALGLSLFLYESCIGRVCSADMTCDRGACRTLAVGLDEYYPIDPNRPAREIDPMAPPDASPDLDAVPASDAGVRVDASLNDASTPDGAVPDVLAFDGASDSGWGGCNRTDCPTGCIDGDLCAIAGAGALSCPTGLDCSVTCISGSRCEVDCSNAASCYVQCLGAAACDRVVCGNVGPCDVTCEDDGACGTITCGPNMCSVTCDTVRACAELDCSTSCNCHVGPLVPRSLTCPDPECPCTSAGCPVGC